MKLRQYPEDFKVEEVSATPISETEDNYKVYRMKKIGLETFAVLQRISKHCNIPLSSIGIAGLKDKHAVTTQHLSIPSNYSINIHTPELNCILLGFTSAPIRIGQLTSNAFEITVRDIRMEEYKKLKLPNSSIPNYYDSQRFGSVTDGTFIAKHIINKDFESAVKTYFTPRAQDNQCIKLEKRKCIREWETISKVTVRSSELRHILHGYKTTRSWKEAYKRIPASIRQIQLFAYQSFLWNECIKRMIYDVGEKKSLFSVPYAAGTLLFSSKNINLPATFKTISPKLTCTSQEQHYIQKVLKRERLELKDFEIQTGFFKTDEREVCVIPKNFTITSPMLDERNAHKYKCVVKFTLAKGSYATVVLKSIFRQ